MKRLGKEHGIPGQVAMEQIMACGIGPCYVCVRTFEVDGQKELRRVCIEGPVFDLQEASDGRHFRQDRERDARRIRSCRRRAAFSTDVAQVIDLNRLGALVAKTVSREFRIGNPPPRVAELECGMINSIGLPTKGIEYFLEHQVPEYKRFTPPLVGSITAITAEDFEAMTREVGTVRRST